jgi:hypothetical protein
MMSMGQVSKDPAMYTSITDTELKSLAKSKSAATTLVYVAIKLRAFGRKSSCYPSRKTIQKDLGGSIGLSTITKAIAELVSLGLIKRIHNVTKNLWSFVIASKQAGFKQKDPLPTSKHPPARIQASNNKDNKETYINNKGNWLNQAINWVLGIGPKPDTAPKGDAERLKQAIYSHEHLTEYGPRLLSLIEPNLENSLDNEATRYSESGKRLEPETYLKS